MIMASYSKKVIHCIWFLIIKCFTSSRVKYQPGLGLVGLSALIRAETEDGRILFGKRPIVGKHVELLSRGDLSVGDYLNINPYSRIVCHEKISIGSEVLIARYVTILDHDHAYQFKGSKLIYDGYTAEPISIGDNVWICDKVTILKGVTIGNNVIIGANSLVNRNIPSNSIAGGNPCRVLRNLN